MKVDQLSEAEQAVLLALVGLMARADGTISDSELGVLEELREELGPEPFKKARDAAAAFDGGAAILDEAAKVMRPEAREAIFEIVVDTAAPDTIAENEAELLRRLADTWGLESPFAD